MTIIDWQVDIFTPKTVKQWSLVSYREGVAESVHLYPVDERIIAENVTHW